MLPIETSFDSPESLCSVKPCSQEEFTPLRIALRYAKARLQEAEYHSHWDGGTGEWTVMFDLWSFLEPSDLGEKIQS